METKYNESVSGPDGDAAQKRTAEEVAKGTFGAGMGQTLSREAITFNWEKIIFTALKSEQKKKANETEGTELVGSLSSNIVPSAEGDEDAANNSVVGTRLTVSISLQGHSVLAEAANKSSLKPRETLEPYSKTSALKKEESRGCW